MSWRRWLLLCAAAVLLAAAAGAAGQRFVWGGGTLSGPPSAPFRLSYPDGWRPLGPHELAVLRPPPLAGLRRDDGAGFIVVRSKRRVQVDPASFPRELADELRGRLPDFEQVSREFVPIDAGRGFLYTYVRQRARTVHSILVVPAGSRSYVLYTVSPAGARDAVREIGTIISSFSTRQ